MSHKQISYIKSVIRFFAFIFLIEQHFILAGTILIIAEGVGMFEEINE